MEDTITVAFENGMFLAASSQQDVILRTVQQRKLFSDRNNRGWVFEVGTYKLMQSVPFEEEKDG